MKRDPKKNSTALKKTPHSYRIQKAILTAANKAIHIFRAPAALALTVLCALTQWAAAQPTVGAVDVAGIMLCTNTELNCPIVSSGAPLITNVILSYTTTLINGGGSTSVTTNVNKFTTGLGTTTATLTFPLIPNVIYTELSVTALDSTGASGETNCVAGELVTNAPEAFDTLQPSLVIEAEDYNYTNGGYMNTPADGGLALYTNQVGVANIDFYWIKSTGPATYYRPTDALNGLGPQCETTGNNWQLMPQKFWTALANGDTTDVPIEIGYNSTGNWLNYTRDFGAAPSNSAPAGSYNVYAFSSDDDTADPSFSLSEVTSDPTTTNQTTTTQLGYFNLTDANWNNYYYVPMLDKFGNLASINLSGHETLRLTVEGEANMDFIMLVPAIPILSPVLQYSYPDGSEPFQLTNLFTFTVGAANGAGVPSDGIELVLNGENITGKVNLTGSTNSWTGTIAILTNTLYTGTLTVTNLAGSNSVFTLSFDTFNVSNYQFEAVDYDFSTNTGTSLPAAQGSETNAGWISGLFIDNPVPTGDVSAASGAFLGRLTNDSYFEYPEDILPDQENGTNGAVAQQGVDVQVATVAAVGNGNVYYRADGVGMQPATDYVRPKFLAAQKSLKDPNIGQFNVGWTSSGDWENYTRHYPAGTYSLYARIAGNSAWSGSSMAIVTNGVGTANQEYTTLGTFADPNANGWQSYHWIPCVDSTGLPAKVTMTGDQTTLKFLCGGGVNELFYMLVPYQESTLPILLSSSLSDATEPFATSNSYTFEVSSGFGPAVASSGIGVLLNGASVPSSELTLSSSSTNWTGVLTLPASNAFYTIVISVTNADGQYSIFTKTFDNFDINNYQWEANDYDYNGGQFIDDPVPTADTTAPLTGHSTNDSYFEFPANIANAAAISNIDFFDQNPQTVGSGSDYYRADGQGSQPATDYVRPKFLNAQTMFADTNIGPFNLGWTSTGDWLNYTRHYPAGTYNIFGRIAGNSAWSGTVVSMVTSGVGTTNQTLDYLGSFADPNANGWQSYHWIPAINTNTGAMSAVTLTGEQTTLRVTCGGGVNEAYYMLVPAAAAAPAGPKLSASFVGGQISISIPTATGSSYQLLHSSLLTTNTASWSAMGAVIVGDGAVHTVTQPVSGSQGYYKVEVQ